MASIKPATDSRPATIEPSSEDRAKIERIGAEVFIGDNKFPSGLRLKISENESLSEEARNSLRGGILETV